jgi:hypothetical protein
MTKGLSPKELIAKLLKGDSAKELVESCTGYYTPQFHATSWVTRRDGMVDDYHQPHQYLQGHFTPPADIYDEGGYVPHTPESFKRDWPISALESLIRTSYQGELYAAMMDFYSEQIARQSGEDVDEATAWVPTKYTTIKDALKQTMKGLKDFRITKQSVDYALATSLFGPMKEFMVVQSPLDIAQGTAVNWTKHRIVGTKGPLVYIRTLKADEKPAR